MDTSIKISIISVVAAVVSAILAYLSYRKNGKLYLIAQTPVLIPILSKRGDSKYFIFTTNTHESAIAKEVCITLKGAKLSKVYSRENEFITPNMSTYRIEINESVDGASFEITYKNIFGKFVFTKGTIHEMVPGQFDLQNIDFKIEGINDNLSNMITYLLP